MSSYQGGGESTVNDDAVKKTQSNTDGATTCTRLPEGKGTGLMVITDEQLPLLFFLIPLLFKGLIYERGKKIWQCFSF